MLTVLRAARMSCSAVCLFASAYATYVPVFGIVLFELAVIVSDRSLIATDTINVASVVELMRGLVYLIGVATGTFEPVAIFV
ncbi:MAG: hypothetical protein IKB68_03355, partial [Rikenellaceae bacterium]|nr:hypothetical protein [Rikenellaceae bacterium]